MLVTPRPGVNRDNLLKALQSVHTDAFNLREGGGAATAYKRLLAYLEWTSNAVRMLGNQISPADLTRLVLTKRYELLLAGAGTLSGSEIEVQRIVNGLVSLELDERVEAFDVAIKTLDRQIRRWSAYGHYIVPDTSFYIEHQQKLEEVDFGPLINVWETEITVFVPTVVIDELDRLKEMCACRSKTTNWSTGCWLSSHWPTARSLC